MKSCIPASCKVLWIAFLGLASISAQAALITIEQRGDSLTLTVLHEGQRSDRYGTPGRSFSSISRMAAEAGLQFDSLGITVEGSAIPWSRVVVSSRIRQPERGWMAALDTLSSDRTQSDDRCGAFGPLAVGQDDFLFGSVFSWGGPVAVSGEVSGDVICLGGGVRLVPPAVVRGSVMAIGGAVSQQAPAKVYGGVYADGEFRFHPVEVSREWEYEGRRYRVRPTFTYDKVDGTRPGLGVQFQDSWLTPRIGLWAGYAFQSERWQYRLSFEQLLATARDLRMGGEYAHVTETEDELFVHALENTLVALLANEDYRDYYGRQGGRVWVAVQTAERHIARIEYENFDYRWLDASARLWSLLWTDRDFRQNFGALQGVADPLLSRMVFERKVSLVRLSYVIDPPARDRYVTGVGYTFDGFLEIGGGILKGDAEYSRIFARWAGWYDFAGRHRVLLQAFGGKARHDTPAPKLFYLGGPATLRGYPVKHLAGHEAFQTTAEYAVRFWENKITDASLVLFYDFGRASFDRRFWMLRAFKSDVGVALDFGGGFRLAVAKALEDSDLAPAVTVRVKAGF